MATSYCAEHMRRSLHIRCTVNAKNSRRDKRRRARDAGNEASRRPVTYRRRHEQGRWCLRYLGRYPGLHTRPMKPCVRGDPLRRDVYTEHIAVRYRTADARISVIIYSIISNIVKASILTDIDLTIIAIDKTGIKNIMNSITISILNGDCSAIIGD